MRSIAQLYSLHTSHPNLMDHLLHSPRKSRPSSSSSSSSSSSEDEHEAESIVSDPDPAHPIQTQPQSHRLHQTPKPDSSSSKSKRSRPSSSHQSKRPPKSSNPPPPWPEGGGIYQKQQATLVVWTEPDGTDMALSFATPHGCLEIWSFLCDVQNRLLQLTSSSNHHPNPTLIHRTADQKNPSIIPSRPYRDRPINSHQRNDAIDWDDDEFQFSSQPISNHHTRQQQQQQQHHQHQSHPQPNSQSFPPSQSTENYLYQPSDHPNPPPSPSISIDPLDRPATDDLTQSDLSIPNHTTSSPPSYYNNLLKSNLEPVSLHQSTQLPDPCLSNLAEIDSIIKCSSRSSIGRERISTYILKKDYVRKLEPVRIEAEDLESLKDLHTLCTLLQTILMLNDAAIYEYCLQDDIVLIAASILDYDPEFGNQKASYHADLSDPTRFKQVVPIQDEQIKSKIHLTYRLQYFKDIILARIMDDSTFSIINSMLFFNQVEIVQYLHGHDEFMRELFGIFTDVSVPPRAHSSSPIIGPSLPPSMLNDRSTSDLVDTQETIDRKIDTILFIQQMCSMAKHLQAPSRINFFRSLAERGILKVIEFGLSKPTLLQAHHAEELDDRLAKDLRDEEWTIRSVACEILMTIIDYDPMNVRGYCLKQRDEGIKTLAESLIELLIVEGDLGLKVQLTDALRILLDMTGSATAGNLSLTDNPLLKRDEDPENERFLQFFYDHCIHVLASPFFKLPDLKACNFPLDRKLVTISSSEAATFNHLCEMICFIITHHSFRSKYFMLSTDLLSKIGSLLTIINAPTAIPSITPMTTKNTHISATNQFKFLELVGLKIFKSCLNKKDEFYDRALIKNSIIDSVVLKILINQNGRDNLVSSACLEFFENIRLNNPRPILNHLMEKEGNQIRKLAEKLSTFQNLIIKWEQNNDRPAPNTIQANSSNLDEDKGAHTGRKIGAWSRSQTWDDDEENYFNDSDEEEDVMIASSSREGAIGSTTGRNEPSITHKRTRSLTGVNNDLTPDFQSQANQETCRPSTSTTRTSNVGGTPVKPLVDYSDEDEDPAPSPPKAVIVPTEELSSEEPPKIRLGERRRRDEDDDDDGFGGLLSGSGRESKRGKRSIAMSRSAPSLLSLSPSSSLTARTSSPKKSGDDEVSGQARSGNSKKLLSTSTNSPIAGKIVLSLASSNMIASAFKPINPVSSSSSTDMTSDPNPKPDSNDDDAHEHKNQDRLNSNRSSVTHPTADSVLEPSLMIPPLDSSSTSTPSTVSNHRPTALGSPET